MSACADKLLILNAFIDCELDAANSVAIEEHLKHCNGCGAEVARIGAVREAMSSAGMRDRASPDLIDRITAQIDAHLENSLSRPSQHIVPRYWLAAGSSAIAASLLLLFAVPQITATGTEDEVIASHVRSLLANHLVDIATSNQHVVRPWFNGRIDFAPPVVDLADKGFPLAGGRLDYIDGRVVPALVYHRRLHSINLFVRPAGSLAVSGGIATSRKGYNLVRWVRAGLEYWAVSDVGSSDLQQFERDFKAQVTP